MNSKLFSTALLLSTLTLLLWQCKPDEEVSFSASLSGQLLDSCGGNPLADEKLEIWDAGTSGNWLIDGIDPKLIGAVTTNSSGKFVFLLTEPLTGGYGIIKNEDISLAEGCFGLIEDGSSRNVGTFFKYPFHRKTTLQLARVTTSKFKSGDKIIIRDMFPRDFDNRDDTIRGEADKQNLYADVDLAYQTKVIQCSQDSVHYRGAFIHLWDVVGKQKSFDQVFPTTTECNTTKDTMYLSRP